MQRSDENHDPLPFYELHGDGVYFTNEDGSETIMAHSRAEGTAGHMREMKHFVRWAGILLTC